MKTIPKLVWLCTGLGLLAAAPVRAQVASPATERFYVNANLGGQLADRTFSSTASATIYDEAASLSATQPVARGLLFDVGAGVRITGNLYAGIVISQFSHAADATYTASVPDPVVFNLPATVTGTATDLDRRELGFHPHVTFVQPLSDKVSIAFGVGGAFIKLTQNLISGFSVPAGTQNVVVALAEESATAKGFFGQADLIYSLTPKVGVGGFARYAGGKADLPSAPDQNVGGMQVGGGIRLRF